MEEQPDRKKKCDRRKREMDGGRKEDVFEGTKMWKEGRKKRDVLGGGAERWREEVRPKLRRIEARKKKDR